MNTSTSQQGFFKVGGTLDLQTPSYVQRAIDEKLPRLILNGEYCNVMAARQLGKSSLMVRTADQLRKNGVSVAEIDLSMIGSSISSVTPNQWYIGLLRFVCQQLSLDIYETMWWDQQKQSSPVHRFTKFVREEILAKHRGQIVIFIDEIDATLKLPFTDDFFAAIRAIYNERSSNPDYKRLTFVLVGVARPADLIQDRTRTPYNIGQTMDLEDFSAKDAEVLLPGLNQVYPKQAEEILQRVFYWTNGHPYLTQRLCAEIVESKAKQWSEKQTDRLADALFFQGGQIRNELNLQRIDDYIRGNECFREMITIYRDIITGKNVKDEERSIAKSQLKLSGLVKATPSGYLQVRNRIYEQVFDLKWSGVSEKMKTELSCVQKLFAGVKRFFGGKR